MSRMCKNRKFIHKKIASRVILILQSPPLFIHHKDRMWRCRYGIDPFGGLKYLAIRRFSSVVFARGRWRLTQSKAREGRIGHRGFGPGMCVPQARKQARLAMGRVGSGVHRPSARRPEVRIRHRTGGVPVCPSQPPSPTSAVGVTALHLRRPETGELGSQPFRQGSRPSGWTGFSGPGCPCRR